MQEPEIDRQTPVEARAVVCTKNGDIAIRRNGGEGVFIAPEKLDGDGEFYLPLDAIAPVLHILGFNAIDVFGSR